MLRANAVLIAWLAVTVASLAGCVAPATPSSPAPAQTLGFAGVPQGTLQGNEIVWTVPIRNPTNESSSAASLHAEIHYAGDGSVDKREAEVPVLQPGEQRTITVTTYYRGYGDYSGLAELRQGPWQLGRAFMFFERCQPILAC